jgi:DNA-binding response OmpR family regulator
MQREDRHLILIADDEADIRDLLRILLEKEGYRVMEAPDGKAAVELAREAADTLSLIVLDIMMPAMDGIEAARNIRGYTDAPILFLTARSSDTDKTSAYGSGGDDYITKPFLALDLKLKIRAMLERYDRYRPRQIGTVEPESLPEGGVRFPDGVVWIPDEQTVLRGGERVVLTELEYELFARLCRGRGENLSPAVLYEDVWKETYLPSSSNTVIVHVANLRRKLEKDPSSPTLIRTVWGKGYRID